jgi:hypothetical protein
MHHCLTVGKVELIAVKFLLQLLNPLLVCIHPGVTTVRLSHDLVDDELRVSVDVKPLNTKFSGDVHTVDRCLVHCHSVGCMEVQSNHLNESITFRRDQHHPPPALLRVKEPSKYMFRCSQVTGG